ncbi:chemotaxis family two-component system sensor kinase Cph1 [Paenibacillus sp. SORGH_AS338]|uniref:diguanylate cyclase domain-containing protein n=2 Tax=unclassified Paenibacillus TaxID=185978 RepID=UPI0028608E2F|nr:diguanylate cyclase [Paenibacillus sp. SORGH_AS_0338]MDR6109782.1 chemotaxis family two-component system sensor kinase Cph1 [Paenibacillus sp. SORGH_AS_0338]
MSVSKNNEYDLLNRTLLTEGKFTTQEPIDLTNCDKEPIHIPGQIQPHGVLLAITKDNEHTIVQASRNTMTLFGIEAEELLGQPLASLIGEEQLLSLLQYDLSTESTSDLQYTRLMITLQDTSTEFFVILHESEGLIILEFELDAIDESTVVNDFEWIRAFFGRVKQTKNRFEASQVAAEQIKEMLGYDRVMIYEFDENWNGKVIAEAKETALEPFLGHNYPASDIPKQARELYLRNWLRTIVDVHYTPVEIIPTVQPVTGKPLNLSLSILRSVSPLHIEYLHNMGVGATVTISLIHDNQLWGLITCHHYSPKYIPHRVRNLCNFLGSFFSSELYQRQQIDDYESELAMRRQASRIADVFIGNTSFVRVIEQLQEEETTLLSLMSASGAAISYQDKLLLYGQTPTAGQIRELAGWLGSKAKNHVYANSRLSLDYEPAKAYKEKASGALYLALSPGQQNYIIWFRPEVLQIVDWAGDPVKAVIQDNDGMRLSPRKSFEKWRQVVQSTSFSWKAKEINILPELKTIVHRQTENQLQQVEELALQNARILRQNEQRYLQLMELSPVAFMTITNGQIIYSNSEAAELFGAKTTQALIGKEFAQYIGKQSQDDMQKSLDELQENVVQLISTNGFFIDVDQNMMQLEVTLTSITYGGKPSVMMIARLVASNIEQAEAYSTMSDQLHSYLATDPLTDIPNRPAFEKSLELNWDTALAEQQYLTVFLIDLDGLRAYNAIHGLNGGDLCLQWVADVLAMIGSIHDATIARFSGGAFTMMLLGSDQAHAKSLAQEISQSVLALQIPRDTSNSGEFMTVTIGGVSVIPTSSMRPSDMIDQAERSLMRAKNKGKNQIFCCDGE